MSTEVIAEGFQFPEGPTWHPEGHIFVVNVKSNIVHRVSENGEVEEFTKLAGKGNGSTLGDDGRIYVTDHAQRTIVRCSVKSGEWDLWVYEWNGSQFRGPNDLVFDQWGRLYFTDPAGSSAANPIGAVYCRETNGDVVRIGDGFAFPNGVAVDLSGRHVYVAESQRNRILRWSLFGDGETWEVFSELPEGGEPDGIRFDSEGYLYVAQFGAGKIHVLKPHGELSHSINVGGANPTNLEFGGPDGKDLYITEAETNTLRCVKLDVAGQRFLAR